MVLLRSLDLFTGIGGMTLALEGVARPVAYCEISESCRDVLRANMAAGRLPVAPIHDDVRTLRLKKKPIDLIVGGFPCVGFSRFGKQEGFDESQSSLFFEMVRVIRETRPTFVFMENVPGVLRAENLRRIVDALAPMGYDMRWCMAPAYAVGSPQNRYRWFCLASRPDERASERATAARHTSFPKPSAYVPKDPTSHARRAWRRGDRGIPRLIPPTPAKAQRCRMLGNAVVPDCARLAWNYLVSVGEKLGREVVVGSGDRYPVCGAVIGGRTFVIAKKPVIPPKPNLGIVIDPRVYRGTPVNAVTHRVLTAPVAVPLWSTPRHSGIACSHVLTERTIRDLACQLRFATSTPAAQRSGASNPEWIEWLMGFPRGWTAGTRSRTAGNTSARARTGRGSGGSRRSPYKNTKT